MWIVASSSSGEDGLNQSLGANSSNQKFRTWSGVMSVISMFVYFDVMALCIDRLTDVCGDGMENVRLQNLRGMMNIPK